MIRNATMEDVKKIHKLLNYYAEKALLLGRSYSALYDQLRDFKVYVDEKNNLMGACALHIIWENLAEIRSLAVYEAAQGKRVGEQLVRACLEEAAEFKIDKVFTLTYQAGFFRKIGFYDVDKGELPHKIWSDCINCPKFPDCDEEALECSVTEIVKKK